MAATTAELQLGTRENATASRVMCILRHGTSTHAAMAKLHETGSPPALDAEEKWLLGLAQSALEVCPGSQQPVPRIVACSV